MCCNTLVGQDRNTLVGLDFNVLEGQNSNIIACRYHNIINLTGKGNIAVGANGTKMKGIKGNVMCFVEHLDNITHTKTIIIDGKKYKENVYYQFKDNKIIKAE